ncbi:MAG: putative zinc ribbon domain protein [Chthoniobacteraceae bacterium]|nr:putative zinc ribbon domain protein [Chthoniobacteraceae bacterium]MDB6172041.1 putative zinc ribbon domain protein [Chthoniobacteraceae bacterium]
MLKEIEQLLILQDRDRKIRALKTELKLLPGERKAMEEKLAKSTQQYEAEKLKGKSIEVERKGLEIEAATKRDTIAKYNLQKFQTRKNEEFQAITNEIKRYEADVSALEDRELELMEAADQQKRVVAEAEKGAAEVKAQFARNVQYLEEKIVAIQEQLKELETDRTRLAGHVEEDLLDTYNRLFNSKSDNAVVGLDHEVCTGCHMRLTASTSAKVRAAREVAHCEQCGRILYWVN